MHPMGRKREEAFVLKFLYCLFLGASSDFVVFGFLCLFGVERKKEEVLKDRSMREGNTKDWMDGEIFLYLVMTVVSGWFNFVAVVRSFLPPIF